jgi:hypothetical protein
MEQDLIDQYNLQQAMRASQQPYSSPLSSMQGNMVVLTNPEDEIYKFELALRGKMLNREGLEVVVSKPLLNNQGVASVIGQVQAAVNRVAVMSNFDGSDIPRVIELLADGLVQDLMMNRINYEITDGSARNKIFNMSLLLVFITCKRALDEGDRRFWKGTQQEITTRIEGMPGGKKKGGLLGVLSGAWK